MDSPGGNHRPSDLTVASKQEQGRLTTFQESQRNERKSSGSVFSQLHHDGFAHKEQGECVVDATEVPWLTSQRFKLALLCFCGFMVLYAQRVNLSIAIVCMSSQIHEEKNSTNSSSNVLTEEEKKCPKLSKSDKDTEFHWSKDLEGLILGAFYWGYLVLQVPGGRLSETIGAKRIIAAGMFPVAILNIISPPVARLSPYAFYVLRVLIGVGESVMYAAAQALWVKWAPPNERSMLIGISYAGGQFGNAMIFPVGGFLCENGFDGGWASVFYIIGLVGFMWCCAWMVLASDTPQQNTRIGKIELKYIENSLKSRKTPKTTTIPWKAMLTSRAVWAIIVAHMCGNYGIYMCLSKIPSYMKEVLHFDLKSNGVMSMMPYLAFWFFITLGGSIADRIVSRNLLSIGNTRKVMTIVGTILPAVFIVATGYIGCDQPHLAVALLTASVGACGFHFSGHFINQGDIAPPYAGTLFGITNTFATIPGIVSPSIVSAMTPNGTREEWQGTFYVAAAVYVTGAVVYTLFGTGEVQPWAKCDDPPAVADATVEAKDAAADNPADNPVSVAVSVAPTDGSRPLSTFPSVVTY